MTPSLLKRPHPETEQPEPQHDRLFWLSIYAALTQIVKAIKRRFLPGVKSCPRCGK